jgi:cell division protein FtsQ
MSSVFYADDRLRAGFAEGVRDSSARGRTSGRGWDLKRIFSLIILFLILVMGLELLFHFVITEKLVIDHVEVSVEKGFPLSDDEILSVAGITGDECYFLVNKELIRQRLEAYPAIRSALVTKGFPNTVRLSLTMRKPLASAILVSGGKSRPVLFDEEGVAFYEGTSLGGEVLPVLSGDVLPADMGLGDRLPREVISVLEDLKKLKASSPVLFGLISELKFVRKSGSGYEVLLYPSHHRIRIRLGQSLSEGTLKYVVMVLDVIAREGVAQDLEELDFRTGEIVYRVRGN